MIAEYRHTPAMLCEVLEWLHVVPGETVVDCTLGGAGHSVELAKRLDGAGLLIGIDQDDSALATAEQRIKQEVPQTAFKHIKGNFGELDSLLQRAAIPGVDAFLFDLGVSSPQLDVPGRGFSYHEDAPLDMRMDPGNQTLNAAEVINTYNKADLTRILTSYGEERWASRISTFIIERREQRPIKTTLELVEIIKAAIPASARRQKHPARKSFQAIRIEVNDEIGVLKRGLEAAIRWLNPNGRIAVISYHSLEDRIVKQMFRELSEQSHDLPPDFPVEAHEVMSVLQVMTRKPVLPSEEEILQNPRARSAKLRVARRTEAIMNQ